MGGPVCRTQVNSLVDAGRASSPATGATGSTPLRLAGTLHWHTATASRYTALAVYRLHIALHRTAHTSVPGTSRMAQQAWQKRTAQRDRDRSHRRPRSAWLWPPGWHASGRPVRTGCSYMPAARMSSASVWWQACRRRLFSRPGSALVGEAFQVSPQR